MAEVGKPKHSYTSCAIPEEMFARMREIVTPAEMEEAVFTDKKQDQEENIRVITEKFAEAFVDQETGWKCWTRRFTSTRRRSAR